MPENSDFAEDLSQSAFGLGYAHCGECHKVCKITDMVLLDWILYCKDCAKGETK